MAQAQTVRQRVMAALGEQARTHARVILPLGAVVAVGVVLLVLLIALYAVVLGQTAYAQLVDFVNSPESAALVTVALIIPVALVGLLAGLVWAGTAVQIANAAATSRHISTPAAALTALRRAPRAALVVIVVTLAFLVAVVAAPLLVLAGIVGLVVNSRTHRWNRSTLITMAVPFGVAVMLLVRWSLALPSTWLAGTMLRAALADSAQRSRGREVRLAVALLLSALVSVAITEGLVAASGSLGLVGYSEFFIRIAAIILVGPLLPVALALQYRKGADAPPAAPAVNVRTARRARTAIAVTVALVIPLLIASTPAPAMAAGSTEVTFLIDLVQAEPLSVVTPTTVTFSVANALTSEVQQPTGELAVSIDGVPLTGPFTLAGNGDAYVLNYTFTPGSHFIEAAYSGDATYESKLVSRTVQAGATAPAVETTTAFTLSPSSPSVAGGTVTAHVTVSPNAGLVTPTGTVGVYINDQSQPPLAEEPLVAGAADLDFVLPPGANHVVVYYTADAGFNDSHIDGTQYVSKYTPSVVVSPGPSSVYGESFALSATVTAGMPATGTVTFEVIPASGPSAWFGPASLDGSGVATATASGLSLGGYSVVAHYSGDGSVAAADSVSIAHTVAVAGVDVAVHSSVTAPSYGDTTVLTVTVTPTAPGAGIPSGSVTVTSDDGETFGPTTLTGAGFVNVTAGVGDAGDRSYTASYSGDDNFGAASASLDLTVAPLTTTTRVSGPYARSAHYGDSQTYLGGVSTAGGSIPTGTVELLVAGERVDAAEATLAGDGTFTITTDLIPVMAEFRQVTVHYLGDGNHSASTSPVDPTTETITLQLQKAQPALVLSSDATAGSLVGDTMTLTAVLDDLGAGPSGDVTFTDLSTEPDTELGHPSVVGHTATLVTPITSTTMQIVAAYEGDDNFAPASSNTLAVPATKVTPTVTLVPVGEVEYGTFVTLDATVAMGGLHPTLAVQFRTSSNVLLGSVVPDITGHAKLQVCAGGNADCPDAMPYVGSGALGLTATYPASVVNFSTESASVDYSTRAALTTTVVSINPTTVDPGAGIYLTATVSGVTSQAIPSGDVTFYASMPDGHGGFADSVITGGTLDSTGVATVFVTAGTELTDIRWPAAAIRAQYTPNPSTKFASSDGSTPVTVDRFDVTLTGHAPNTVTPFVPAAVTVVFDHEPGASAAYTGTLTITQDVGPGCVISLPAAAPIGCNLTWSTTGAHSYTASYSGDLVYEPATSAPVPVNIGVATPNFIPGVASSAVAETDVTVTWNLFSTGATGTVTVWGDGTLWCTTPLATQTCTGQFGTASATGSPVEVIVRYSGDINWGSAEVHKPVLVKRCVVPDVTSAQPSLGSVQITTVSNCGAGGYVSGTLVTATATPIAPNVFVNWKKLGGSGLIVDTSLPTVLFTVTTDSTTWVRVANFSLNCYPVTATVSGHGGMSVYPASNCTALGGVAGYTPGTVVTIYPDTLFNSYYGEPDAFYSFGAVAGGTVANDSSGRPRLTVTVNDAIVVPVTFGPQCRAVKVVFDPASTGDVGAATTAENCQSPQGNGFVRYTPVSVNAVSGDPTLAITGWTLNGVPQPAWGAGSTQSLTIGTVVPVLTVQLAHCYSLDVIVDGAFDARLHPIGQVNVDAEPNCPDGSDRYLAGTKVTLTPEVLVDGAGFNGWDDAQMKPEAPNGVGEVPSEAKIVTMTADLTVKAGFYLGEACSTLTVADNIDLATREPLVTLDDDGCGDGQYSDEQKRFAAQRGGDKPQSYYSDDSSRTKLQLHVNPDLALPVYASVKGDVGTCFRRAGVTADADGWRTYGPLRADESCAVGGPILLQVATCQKILSTMSMTVAGDTTGKVYDRSWVPDSLMMPNPDGLVGAFDVNAFTWMVTAPNSQFSPDQLAALGDDPCTKAATDLYSPGRYRNGVGLYAFGPTDGFVAAGWGGVDPAGPIPQNPVALEITDDAPSQMVYPVFEVTCHTLALGRGITVIDGAYCPGSYASENSFIAGTAVQVRAVQVADDRILAGFTIGVVANQVVEDKDTGAMTAFVVVDGDKSVRADYPSKSEAVRRAIVQGLKISVGILAVLAPIALGMVFPPAGILFAFLGAGAGILNLIPHGKEVAGVFDLLNPTKITTCAARWGFSNTGDPTGGLGAGGIISTANTTRKVLNGINVLSEKVGPLGIAGGIAGVGYGLYDAGIGHTDFSPQSIEDLAGTSTMTGCLDQQWHTVGSNLGGN